MNKGVIVRPIQEDELRDLLLLYRQLQPEDPILDHHDEEVLRLWSEMLQDPLMVILGAECEGRIVSTCTIAMVRNLTRGARAYAIIENVVTHLKYRHQGYGRLVLQRAYEIAEQRNCYKVMLMTGSKNEETLRFYEGTGLQRGIKTGFIKYF